MRLLSALILGLLFLSPPLQAEEFAIVEVGGDVAWRLISVVDGDTFRVEAQNLPPSLSHLLIRVRGIDTPEIGGKAKCPWELAHGEEARQFTAGFLAQGNIRLESLKWDKYGGRVLANVFVNNRSLAKGLLAKNLARSYSGKKRAGWC